MVEKISRFTRTLISFEKLKRPKTNVMAWQTHTIFTEMERKKHRGADVLSRETGTQKLSREQFS